MKKRWIGMLGILTVALTGCSFSLGSKNEKEETNASDPAAVIEDVVDEVLPAVVEELAEPEADTKPEEDVKTPEEDASPEGDTPDIMELPEEPGEDEKPSEEGAGEEKIIPELSYEDLVGVFSMTSADIDDGFVTTHYLSTDGILSTLVFNENGTVDFSYLSYDEEFNEYGLLVETKEGAGGLEGTIREDISAETWTFVYDGEILTFYKETKVNASNTTKNTMIFEKNEAGL